ncbi:MAG: MoxR family ATPase [Alicyclobacillus macrosporangiidus]|nr:MoxR family ATPase [Alicyclobacillus macrosporangiidus]
MRVALSPTTHLEFDGWRPELQAVVDNVEKVIIGKQDVIRLVLVALLAGGHCLIEDVPGVGKTMLVRAFARSLGCEFKRIQFTPDLLPSDVTGISVYNQQRQAFEFRPGPIFGQIVLADEINRTSPKTQSALLEALEERSVTVDGRTYPLANPFFVMATENPIEFEGTFPLPEAQVDRFLLKFSMGYPSFDDEVMMLGRQQAGHPIERIQAVAGPEDVVAWRQEVASVRVEDSIRAYIVRLVHATRAHRQVYLGASPRASIALFKAAQALAYVCGRDYVVPDDVRYLAPFVLQHRVLLSADARLSGVQVGDLLRDLVGQVAIPAVHTAGRSGR